MSDEALAAMPDEELERLALYLPVSDERWRDIWREYEKRNYGMLAKVLRNGKEEE